MPADVGSAGARPAGRAGASWSQWTPRLVLGACTLALLGIVGYPLLWLLFSAFGLPQGLGTAGLERAFTRSANLIALENTLILSLGAGLMSVVLGMPLAWATARSTMPLRRTIHALVALSYITPPYLTALAYIILLGPEAGFINRLLQPILGIKSGPFNAFSLGGVVFVISLHVFAFTYFLTHAALQSIDASLEEAAQILGARRWGIARFINLPLVAPAITGGALLAAVDSMALFGPQALLGLPAQVTFLPTRIYSAISSYPPRWSEASSLSLILVVLTALGLYAQHYYLNKRSFVTVSGKGVRPARAELGFWTWPLLAFCALVVLFSAILPLGVLVYAAFSKSWTAGLSLSNLTFDNIRDALIDNQTAHRGIVNSFRLAAVAALVASLLGLAIAYIDLRTTMRGRRLLDYLAILPLGLPGTVMAVGLILAFIRPPVIIYGTIWILLVAYIARFLPLATRTANSTLRQIDPSLEEAARITGATWLGAIRSILFPLAAPGLVTAYLLVFIPALGELSATILLYTSGTETIAVALYRLNDLGQLEVVAALAVFTIAVILSISLLLSWLSGRASHLKSVETQGQQGGAT